MWSRIAQNPHLTPWRLTPQGASALVQEKKLLQDMLSPWPRRGHSLLEITCGAGDFLELFWESGFDATGIDTASPQLNDTRQRLQHKADIHAGQPDDLPFADNTFDYAALLSPLTRENPCPEDVLREAVRVSARGCLVRCWNPTSLAGLWRQRWLCPGAREESPPPPEENPALWLGWRDYCAILRSLSPGCHISTRSTLLGPPPTWESTHWLARCNRISLPLPLGAVTFLRVTHAGQRPLSGLPLRLNPLRMESNSLPLSGVSGASGVTGVTGATGVEGTALQHKSPRTRRDRRLP